MMNNGKVSRLFRIWSNMKTRCNNPKSTGFKYWGGKGISVDPRWKTLSGFVRTMPSGYSDALMLDRRDSNLGYSPENCRWVTRVVQNNNKSDTIIIEIGDEKKTLAEWCRDERCTISRKMVWARIKKLGWSVDRAIFTPSRRKMEAA